MKDQKHILESARSLVTTDTSWKKKIFDAISTASGEILSKVKLIERIMPRTQRSNTVLTTNDAEHEKDEIEILNKKIRVSDLSLQQNQTVLKKKEREIEESKEDLTEYRRQWDIVKIQMSQLKEYLNKKPFFVVCDLNLLMSYYSTKHLRSYLTQLCWNFLT